MHIQCPLRVYLVLPTAVGRRGFVCPVTVLLHTHVRLVPMLLVAAAQVLEVMLVALVLAVPLLKVAGVWLVPILLDSVMLVVVSNENYFSIRTKCIVQNFLKFGFCIRICKARYWMGNVIMGVRE